ncbi:MAG: hypothetical protein ACR2MU_08615 [Gaiellaceae bacterium]
MSAAESLGKAEELLARLESTRDELEKLAVAEDAKGAIAVLAELAELAKQVEAELGRAKRQAELDAGA